MEPKKLIPIFVVVLVLAAVYFLVFSKNETGPLDAGFKGESLLGIDSDNNGIRDDVDQFISLRYGTNTLAVKGAQISARAYQYIMMTDPLDKVASRDAMEKSGDAGVCAGRAFRKAGLFSGDALEEIYVRTYNSSERLKHKQRVGAASGQFERSVVDVVCE